MKETVLPIVIAALTTGAEILELSENLKQALTQNNYFKYAVSDAPEQEPLRKGQHYIFNGHPDSDLDDESELLFFHGWLRCCAYHQIDLFLIAKDRSQADNLLSNFQSEVNKLPNKRQKTFVSETLQYDGQVVKEEVDLNYIHERSKNNKQGLVFTIMAHVQA